jgi:hypothetical protein
MPARPVTAVVVVATGVVAVVQLFEDRVEVGPGRKAGNKAAKAGVAAAGLVVVDVRWMVCAGASAAAIRRPAL